MRTLSRAFCLCAVLSTYAVAKQDTQKQPQTIEPVTAQTAKTSAALPRKQALELLKRTEQLCASVQEPASRTLALVQVARLWQKYDVPHSVAVLENAYQSSRTMQASDSMERRDKSDVIAQVMESFVAVAPEQADALLPELEPEVRGQILSRMLEYYTSHGKIERAIEILRGIAAESEMPYRVATLLMQQLPREDDGEVRGLFNEALASYQQHDQGAHVGGSFPEMIVAVHERLTPAQTLAAIDEVLAGARKADEKLNGALKVTLSSGHGAAELNNQYDYSLFLLLPTLHALEPGKADRLEREDRTVQSLMARYPEGVGSLQAKDAQGRSGMSTSISTSNAGGKSFGGDPSGDNAAVDQHFAARIEADAQEHPQQALANVALVREPYSRAHTYLAIVRMHWKKNTGVARTSLTRLNDMLSEVDGQYRWNLASKAAQLYLQMEDAPSAKKMIERGMDMAGALYKQDINADEPNTAPKILWPSTNAWRSMATQAYGISPMWAQDLLKGIEDDDIRNLVSLSLTQATLGIPAMGPFVKVNSKRTSWTYTEY